MGAGLCAQLIACSQPAPPTHSASAFFANWANALHTAPFLRYRGTAHVDLGPVAGRPIHRKREPMALTGAQVKQLRSMAHHLNPAIIIGKSDVNEGTVEQTVAYLEKHELVKCSVLDGSSLSAREAAEELAERCHAEVVQVIGRKFSLYRESSRKDIEKIKLV